MSQYRKDNLHRTGVLGENLARYPFFHHKSLIDRARIEPECALSALFCVYIYIYTRIYIYIHVYIFLFGATTPNGPGPPHSRSF
jgi:hypothetical protein